MSQRASEQKQTKQHQKGASQDRQAPVQAVAAPVGLGRGFLQSGPDALSVPGWLTIGWHVIHYSP